MNDLAPCHAKIYEPEQKEVLAKYLNKQRKEAE